MIRIENDSVRCLYCRRILGLDGPPDPAGFRAGRGLRLRCAKCRRFFEMQLLESSRPGEQLRALVEIEQCPDCRQPLSRRICSSNAGYYIGTWCKCGPYQRDSEYFPTQELARLELEGRASTPGWNPGRFSVKRQTKARSAAGHRRDRSNLMGSTGRNSGAERARDSRAPRGRGGGR